MIVGNFATFPSVYAITSEDVKKLGETYNWLASRAFETKDEDLDKVAFTIETILLNLQALNLKK